MIVLFPLFTFNSKTKRHIRIIIGIDAWKKEEKHIHKERDTSGLFLNINLRCKWFYRLSLSPFYFLNEWEAIQSDKWHIVRRTKSYQPFSFSLSRLEEQLIQLYREKKRSCFLESHTVNTRLTLILNIFLWFYRAIKNNINIAIVLEKIWIPRKINAGGCNVITKSDRIFVGTRLITDSVSIHLSICVRSSTNARKSIFLTYVTQLLIGYAKASGYVATVLVNIHIYSALP